MRDWSLIWDVTYACNLRCSFCYSESGRRPSRIVRGEALKRIVDAICNSDIGYVAMAGGEPALHPDLFKIVERFRAERIDVSVFTAGYLSEVDKLSRLLSLGVKVHVSLDSPDEAMHNHMRGRPTAFGDAIRCLNALDDVCAAQATEPGFGTFGVDCVLTRRNVGQVSDLVRFAQTFKNLSFVALSPALPAGLASRSAYAENELLDFSQFDELGSRVFLDELRSNVRPSVALDWFDSRKLRMGPQDCPGDFRYFQLEPDGLVRAYGAYEGTVADLREHSFETARARVLEERNAPWRLEILKRATTMVAWAAATREISRRCVSSSEAFRVNQHV